MLELLQLVLWLVVEYPFLYLYERGPRLNASLGFWEGAARPEVCAELTRVPADHWALHPDQCTQLVYSKAYSWVVAIYAVL
jgi:hypothetical protein